MTTVVNTPGSGGSNMGLVVALIILLVFILFIVFYGLPFTKGNGQSSTAPSNNQPGIAVPSKIDVNVNNTP